MTNRATRPWSEFAKALMDHLGPKRAQTNFSEHTGYSLSSIQHWRKSEQVPEEAFDALKKVDPALCTDSTFTGYHTTMFTQRVLKLSEEKKTLSLIAKTLSKEFDRPVTENMIKGVRYRNKAKIKDYQSRQINDA